MEKRFIFLDNRAKKIPFDSGRISEKPIILIPQATENIPPEAMGHHSCPDCLVRLVRFGNCFSCPLCGYGGCS